MAARKGAQDVHRTFAQDEVERVAQAIFGDDENWRLHPQEWREQSYPAARRAIAALEKAKAGA